MTTRVTYLSFFGKTVSRDVAGLTIYRHRIASNDEGKLYAQGTVDGKPWRINARRIVRSQ